MQTQNVITLNPVFLLVETWIVRVVTAGAIALFGDGFITGNTTVDIAGVVSATMVFVVNETLHYLKTNKKVVTAVASESAAVASDPIQTAALANLLASLKTLETNLANTPGGTSNVQPQ